jgi:hypothetical protein
MPCNERCRKNVWPNSLFYWHFIYFMVIWYILKLFRYIFPVLVPQTKKNLATLEGGGRPTFFCAVSRTKWSPRVRHLQNKKKMFENFQVLFENWKKRKFCQSFNSKFQQHLRT